MINKIKSVLIILYGLKGHVTTFFCSSVVMTNQDGFAPSSD